MSQHTPIAKKIRPKVASDDGGAVGDKSCGAAAAPALIAAATAEASGGGTLSGRPFWRRTYRGAGEYTCMLKDIQI